jgi:hypothetical protein
MKFRCRNKSRSLRQNQRSYANWDPRIGNNVNCVINNTSSIDSIRWYYCVGNMKTPNWSFKGVSLRYHKRLSTSLYMVVLAAPLPWWYIKPPRTINCQKLTTKWHIYRNHWDIAVGTRIGYILGWPLLVVDIVWLEWSSAHPLEAQLRYPKTSVTQQPEICQSRKCLQTEDYTHRG